MRQLTWHSSADGHKSLFDIVRGRGGGGDLMKLRDNAGNEVSSTEGIRDIVDGHFDATFNLHEKERTRRARRRKVERKSWPVSCEK